MKELIRKTIIKITAISLLLVVFGCSSESATEKPLPVSVIFDTDMGNDVDDALALLMFYNYEDMGKCKLLCIAHNKDNPQSVVATNIIEERYGRSHKFCAIASGTGKSHDDGWYLKELCQKKTKEGKFFFERDYSKINSTGESVATLRKILSESPDKSVVYVSVGFLSNLSNLLKSQGDSSSHLSGKELLAKKVKYVSAMVGNFRPKALANPAKSFNEFNAATDAKATGYFLDNCPVPVYFSGVEFGGSIRYPRSEIDNFFGKDSPIYEAYNTCSLKHHKKDGKFDWASFDMTSVLFVFEPELFDLSEAGTVSLFDAEGRIKFVPSKDGKHRYFTEKSKKEEIRKRLIDLARVKSK